MEGVHVIDLVTSGQLSLKAHEGSLRNCAVSPAGLPLVEVTPKCYIFVLAGCAGCQLRGLQKPEPWTEKWRCQIQVGACCVSQTVYHSRAEARGGRGM